MNKLDFFLFVEVPVLGKLKHFLKGGSTLFELYSIRIIHFETAGKKSGLITGRKGIALQFSGCLWVIRFHKGVNFPTPF